MNKEKNSDPEHRPMIALTHLVESNINEIYRNIMSILYLFIHPVIHSSNPIICLTIVDHQFHNLWLSFMYKTNMSFFNLILLIFGWCICRIYKSHTSFSIHLDHVWAKICVWLAQCFDFFSFSFYWLQQKDWCNDETKHVCEN